MIRKYNLIFYVTLSCYVSYDGVIKFLNFAFRMKGEDNDVLIWWILEVFVMH